MPWTPETNQGLSSEVEFRQLEETTSKLWAEFMAGYFNGQAHGNVVYPVAAFGFQQNPLRLALTGEIVKDLNGIGIHIVANIPTKTRPRRSGNNVWVLDNPAAWNFYIKANVTGTRSDGHNSDSLCRVAADRLYGLLNNWERTKVLNRAGIMKIRPTPPILAASQEMVTRKMQVSGWIRVVAQEDAVTLMAGDDELQVGDPGDVLEVG